MVSQGAVAGVVVVAVAGAGLAYAYEKGLLTTGKPKVGTASISIHATETSIVVPYTVTFSGMALDAAGNPVAGQAVYLFVNGSQSGNPATTDNSGSYSFDVKFSNAGTYDVYASSNVAGT